MYHRSKKTAPSHSHPIPCFPCLRLIAWTNAAFLIKHFCSVSHFVGQTRVPSGTVRAICWWKRETQKCVGAKVEWWPWKAGWGKLGEMSNRDQVDLRDLLNLSMRDNFNLSVKDHLSMNLRDHLIIGMRDHLNLTEHLNGKTWMCCWPNQHKKNSCGSDHFFFKKSQFPLTDSPPTSCFLWFE